MMDRDFKRASQTRVGLLKFPSDPAIKYVQIKQKYIEIYVP